MLVVGAASWLMMLIVLAIDESCAICMVFTGDPMSRSVKDQLDILEWKGLSTERNTASHASRG